MKNPLIIEIVGPTSSGRTTAAHLIATTLGRYGARPSVEDDDASTWEMTDERLTQVFEGREVIIKTVQTSRPASPAHHHECDHLKEVTLENTEETVWAHKIEDCNGDPCSIHSPSDHHMRSFPQHWRDDLGIMERICKHGVGHPDPDDHTAVDDAVHGCDGCCLPPKAE